MEEFHQDGRDDRKFFHIQKSIYLWQFWCVEFRHLPWSWEVVVLRIATDIYDLVIAKTTTSHDRKLAAYFSLLISIQGRCLNSRRQN